MEAISNSPIEDANDFEETYHPMINYVQKMAVYTNRNRIYLIGANPSQTYFKVLKFERDEPYELIMHDDKVEYTKEGIHDLLIRVNGGKSVKSNSNRRLNSSDLVKEFSAFGIFGVVRFLEGYYIVFITKRCKVATIGQHCIYKIEETKTFYIPHDSVRKVHSDELKYYKLFHNVDLSSNFYFSYSYDLTNSLQYNNAPLINLKLNKPNTTLRNDIMATIDDSTPSTRATPRPIKHYGVKWSPNAKYMWNKYLLAPLEGKIDPCWILPVIHGYLSQERLNCMKGTYNLTLIARRSNKFAGTRFLKRGANFEGDVANEVETEQIIHDPTINIMSKGRFSSFIQTRGSIPCHWSQNTEKNRLPKPPITIDISEPYADTAGKHFNQIFRRFGTPVICLNLVRRREKKPRESILGNEYDRLVAQLNHTLPPPHKIQLVNFDMARINKSADENVLQRLSDIAYRAIKKTGIYFSKPPLHIHHRNPDDNFAQLERSSVFGDKKYGNWKKKPLLSDRGRYQTGVVRVNCVDCLDRTNTAQFVFGRCALAFQLYWLGEIPSPILNLDLRQLESMYEDHGDVLALQYGGSQLVHRIATYRKSTPFASQGNDMKQSVTRYLANTFSDSEKQQAINLFLGVYVPLKLHSKTPLWDLSSDQYLHQSYPNKLPCHRPSTSQWWDSEVMDLLPLPTELVKKEASQRIQITNLQDDKIDLFADIYHAPEFKFAHDYESSNVNQKVTYDKDALKRIQSEKNAQSCSSSRSNSPETEETEEENPDWSSVSDIIEVPNESASLQPLTFEYYFPNSASTYGKIVKPIDSKSMKIYNEYARVANAACGGSPQGIFDDEVNFEPLGDYSKEGSTYGIDEPVVSIEAMNVIQDYVNSLEGTKQPTQADMILYSR